jgi:RNA polymerase sigma-54 factor
MYLSQRMSLQQVLAPQLQQSLALLQAPILDLKAMVEQELEQNPVLEEISITELQTDKSARDGETNVTDTTDAAEPPADVTYDPATEKDSSVVDDFQAEFERLSQLDQEWREHFAQTNLPARRSEEDEEKRQFMFDSLVASTSLQEHLLEQMRLSDLPEAQRPIGELIIGNIDDYGYLKTSVEDLALWMNNSEVTFTKNEAASTLPLGFVTRWVENYQVDSATQVRSVRRTSTRLLTVTGRFLADAQSPEADRRAFLQARREQWLATLASAEGTLVRQHDFHRIVTIVQCAAEISLAADALNWSLTASYTKPAEDSGPEAVEYEVQAVPANASEQRGLLVAGRIASERIALSRQQHGRLQADWLETHGFEPAHRVRSDVREQGVPLETNTPEQTATLPELVFEEEFRAPANGGRVRWISSEHVLEVLKFIQTFHPPGVGARDLRECLLLQMERQGHQDALEFQIVRDHMEALGKRRLPDIARALDISVDEVQKSAGRIALLEPRPGRDFLPDTDQYVLPEVFVSRVDDEFTVTTNDEQVPHLRISNTYKDLMAQADSSEEVRDYIREKIRAGKFLIKSLHQRQQTILNIAREIVKRQREFMEKGVAYLKPMTMVQIAEVVGVHETTVSRAVSGKYMQTPQGVFEMKYFFTSGIQTTSGQGMSNTSVKDMITDLFKREDAHKPLSDQEVVKILSEKGIQIARRTVAKYRAELNILPSNLRKVY